MQTITSRANPLVARFRAIARGDTDDLLLLDGVHLIEEALAAPLQIRHVIVSADAVERPDVRRLVEAATVAGASVVAASSKVMDAVSPVRSASGIVALAERPPSGGDAMYARIPPLVVIASGVQDPGNLGAIVRVAEAGGATGVIAAGGSANPFGWKALRGSMASTLRLPIVVSRDTASAVDDARRRGCRVATVPSGGTPYVEAALRGPLAVLIGGEGGGLPPAIAEVADERVTIPMTGGVESLNAAVAAALMVYEARRQRSG